MAQYLVGSNVDSGYGHLDGSGEVNPLSYTQIHYLPVCLCVGESKAVVLEPPKKYVNPTDQKSSINMKKIISL
jgi:hypothetical protein